MTNMISCANCNEAEEVTSSTVVLPWFCTECREANEFQEAIAPPKPAALVVADRIEPQETVDQMYGYAEPTHEATVENTTLLIEDLEEQLAGQRDLNAKANTLINDMSNQLQEDAAELGERDRKIANDTALIADLSTQNEKLQQRIDALRFAITRMAYKAFRKDQLVAKYVGQNLALAIEADNQVKSLKNEINGLHKMLDDAYASLKTARGGVAYWRGRTQVWHDRTIDLHQTVKRLMKRGLVARVRNAGV